MESDVSDDEIEPEPPLVVQETEAEKQKNRGNTALSQGKLKEARRHVFTHLHLYSRRPPPRVLRLTPALSWFSFYEDASRCSDADSRRWLDENYHVVAHNCSAAIILIAKQGHVGEDEVALAKEAFDWAGSRVPSCRPFPFFFPFSSPSPSSQTYPCHFASADKAINAKPDYAKPYLRVAQAIQIQFAGHELEADRAHGRARALESIAKARRLGGLSEKLSKEATELEEYFHSARVAGEPAEPAAAAAEPTAPPVDKKKEKEERKKKIKTCQAENRKAVARGNAMLVHYAVEQAGEWLLPSDKTMQDCLKFLENHRHEVSQQEKRLRNTILESSRKGDVTLLPPHHLFCSHSRADLALCPWKASLLRRVLDEADERLDQMPPTAEYESFRSAVKEASDVFASLESNAQQKREGSASPPAAAAPPAPSAPAQEQNLSDDDKKALNEERKEMIRNSLLVAGLDSALLDEVIAFEVKEVLLSLL
jgi:vacuolar-type H+-ATPase subunit E/Vma4